ncbi:MAG: galactonate dehydratase [Thermomicrobiales bacterium]
MRITGVETFFTQIEPNLRTWVFVKVSTDAGVHGWGEGTLEGKEQIVAAAIEGHVRQHQLIGADPRQIERLWQIQYRHGFWRGGVVLNTAISAIDQALWDIKGKLAGLPVYELLGGACRDRIRLYTHCTPGDDPAQPNSNVAALVAAGWTALKTSSFGRQVENFESDAARIAEERIAACREAGGPDLELFVDNHGRMRGAVACRTLDALAPYKIGWFEEPVQPEDMDGLRQVMGHPKNTEIATGERYFSPWEFRELIEQKLTDIVQPDICHAGGITALKKIAALAEIHHIQVAPHNPQGPISTAASIHLAAAIPNFRILEFANQLHLPGWAAVQREALPIAPGWAELPDRPGLGIELDEEALARYATDPGAYYPGTHDVDGTPANV